MGSNEVDVKISISGDFTKNMLDVINDPNVKLKIHNILAQRCHPYVPYLNGPLSDSGLAQVTPEYVRYGGSGTDVPYAHRQYYGEHFNHTLTVHPKATAKWDKVMMMEQGESFSNDVENIIRDAMKKKG